MNPSPFFRQKVMKLIGTRRSALDLARGRIMFMRLCFASAFVLVAVRGFDLTILQGELPRLSQGLSSGFSQESSPRDYAQGPKTAPTALRADIVDRNGVILARSVQTASLYADPKLIPDPEGVARDLVKVLPDLSYGDVLKKLQREGRFVWIKRNLAPQDQYAVLGLGHPGLSFETEANRLYPQGALGAHLVGYTNVDGNGLAGVERSFDKVLKAGKEPVQLTIDVRLQHVLRREISRTMKEFNAKGGMGVIMNVHDGEILAAVSLPDFDPHSAGSAKPDNLFNRLSLGVYEMGSTFKLFSTAAYLELKNAPIGQTFDATKPLTIGRFSIRDYHAQKRVLTIPEIFMYSSNIGSALMAQAVGTDALKNFYADLGFMAPVKVEIDEVGQPIIPSPWRETSTLTASYGHGIAVSPLHVAAAASSIVNGGLRVNPHVVLDNIADDKESASVRVVSAETAHRIRQLLRLTVSHGTGGKADVPGYMVGGKTGSAEKPGARGGYDRKRLLSSFLGVFPSDDPDYVVLVIVDEPQGNKSTYGYATGGWVGAPAVGRVITAMASVLALPPKDVPAEKDISAELVRYVHDPKKAGE